MLIKQRPTGQPWRMEWWCGDWFICQADAKAGVIWPVPIKPLTVGEGCVASLAFKWAADWLREAMRYHVEFLNGDEQRNRQSYEELNLSVRAYHCLDWNYRGSTLAELAQMPLATLEKMKNWGVLCTAELAMLLEKSGYSPVCKVGWSEKHEITYQRVKLQYEYLQGKIEEARNPT